MLEYDIEFAEFLYYSPTEMDIESPFWLLRAGHSIAKPGYRVGPRRIECYSIHFVREGRLVVESGGKRTVLQAGDVFCMYPNRTYVYYRENDRDNLQLAWLRFDGPGMGRLLTHAGFKPEAPCRRGKWNAELQGLIEAIFAELRAEGRDQIAACLELKSMLYRFFSYFIQLGEATETDQTVKKSWVAHSMDYIKLHATEGITVQQVANFAGLNRTYFSTIFTKSAGISPADYIANIKMNKAKEMLLTTSASVTEIAYSLGYPTLFAFTRAFKNYHSLSPSGYRKQNNSQ
ncbi:AraC-type DNA-binding protein [Paenibacillaceae bacterium GAS479]|nr:AraC-type DNA-binding protein [Paenibacillaceae bacterium GAS479]